MVNKLEYIRFIMLITIRSNLAILEKNIRNELDYSEQLKDCNPKAAKEHIENINKYTIHLEHTYYLLKNIYGLDSLNGLDILIEEKWPIILTGLCNGIYDYNWELKNFSVEITDEITREVKEYYDILYNERIAKETRYYYNTPLYIDMKYLMVIDNNHNGVPKKIYRDIINNGLFDPNMDRSGTSNEFFWTRQPYTLGFKDNDYMELNRKVICDRRTNYYLLENGSDLLEWYIRRTNDNYKNSQILSDEDKYFLEIISYVFQNNNCSLLDTFRDNGNWHANLASYIEVLFIKNFINVNIDIIDDLRNYCLSRECINKQISIARYPSYYRNRAIDLYIGLINEKYNDDLCEEVSKLQKLKI